MSETKKNNNIKLFEAIGWMTYGLAVIFVIVRAGLDRFPADYVAVWSFVLTFFVAIAAIIGVLVNWYKKKPLSYVITFGGIICPVLCLFAMSTYTFVSPALHNTSVVMYENADPSNAQVIEEYTAIDHTKFSAARYWLTNTTPTANGIIIEYYFDGDILEFHNRFHDQRDQFKSAADSIYTEIIQESTELYRGMYLSDQICYLKGMLPNLNLPHNIKFTGKISLTNRTFITEIVGE